MLARVGPSPAERAGAGSWIRAVRRAGLFVPVSRP